MDITISTRDSDFLGTANLVFVDETSKVVHRLENVDVLHDYFEIHKQLNDNEKSGTQFLVGVRRYILSVHGVAVSVLAAQDYYDTIHKLVERAENFSLQTPDSSGSTESNPPSSPNPDAASTPGSSTESQPPNTGS